MTITYFIEKERSNGFGALLTSAALFAALYFFGSKEPIREGLKYVMDNPMNIVFLVAGYFVAGTLWSFVKWYFYVKGRQRKGDWPTKKVYPKDGEDAFGPYKYVKVAPKAKDHRRDILMWMSWWPFSALWTMMDDPIRKMFEWIFDKLESTFDEISERIFKSTQKEEE